MTTQQIGQRNLSKDEKWLCERLSEIAKSNSEDSADARLLRKKLVASGLSQDEEKFAYDLIFGE